MGRTERSEIRDKSPKRHRHHSDHRNHNSDRHSHHSEKSKSHHRRSHHNRDSDDSESGIDCPTSSRYHKQQSQRVYSPSERHRPSSRNGAESRRDHSEAHHTEHKRFQNPYSEHDDRTEDRDEEDERRSEEEPSPRHYHHHRRSRSPPRDDYIPYHPYPYYHHHREPEPVYSNQRGGYQRPNMYNEHYNYHPPSEYMMGPGGPSMPIKTQINQMLHQHPHNYNQMTTSNITFNSQGVEIETQPRMLSYKEFTASQLDPGDPANKYDTARQSKYNQYKEAFRAEQIRTFFESHKHEDWFRSRYHPVESGKRKAELNKVYKRRLSVFKRLADRYLNDGEVELCAGDDQKLRLGLHRFMDACLVALEGGGDQELDELDSIYLPSHKRKRQKLDGRKSKKAREDSSSEDEDGRVEEPEEGEEESDMPVSSSIGGIPVSITPTIPKKTQSIFFKHLPCHVTKSDLEKIGKQFEGFKRAAISEPAPERGFQRRAWLTFDSSAIKLTISEISARIGKMKINDSVHLSVQVNREVNQKCKVVSGLANHARIVRNDLRLATTIVDLMDKKWSTWSENGSNPYLVEALDYLDSLSRPVDSQESLTHQVSETNWVDNESEKPESIAEPSSSHISLPKCEEIKEDDKKAASSTQETQDGCVELLLLNEEEQFDLDEPSTQNDSVKDNTPTKEQSQISLTNNNELKFELDTKATRLLDNLILYLRIVYSIDFYNATEYLQEDTMPYRCGLLHIRGPYEAKKNQQQHYEQVNILHGEHVKFAFDPTSQLKQTELDEWCRLFESHVRHLTDPSRDTIDVEVARRLGLRDPQVEVSEFILANSHQESKEVWVCLLSEKKFRGPDYVRKHIESKFGDRLEEIRAECDYFNRFLLDPKRPYLPEHPLSRSGASSNGIASLMMSNPTPTGNMYGPVSLLSTPIIPPASYMYDEEYIQPRPRGHHYSSIRHPPPAHYQSSYYDQPDYAYSRRRSSNGHDHRGSSYYHPEAGRR